MQRNNTIDIAKFIAALLVVAIHTALFRDVDDKLYFIFNELICRLGVPFFAICTGYYMYKQIADSGWNGIVKQEKKLLKIYGLWTVLYFLFLLPNWIQIDYLSWENVVGFCKSTVLTGSYYHLWYVLYVIYALPVLYIVLKYAPSSLWVWIAGILYFVNALKYGYSELLPKPIANCISFVDSGYALLGAQFVVLPMMLCGSYLAYQNKKHGLKPNLFCLILSFVLLIIEGFVLKSYVDHDKAVSRIFMILPTAYFLFATLLEISVNAPFANMLSKMSLIIYCVHPMFCRYIGDVIKSSVWGFVFVCIASCVVSFVWMKFIHRRNAVVRNE
ncbi:MAG: acyltransferase [Prevotellaceae bacterium]|nr:acyltransferase [Prevotellaceae bacterium]